MKVLYLTSPRDGIENNKSYSNSINRNMEQMKKRILKNWSTVRIMPGRRVWLAILHGPPAVLDGSKAPTCTHLRSSAALEQCGNDWPLNLVNLTTRCCVYSLDFTYESMPKINKYRNREMTVLGWIVKVFDCLIKSLCDIYWLDSISRSCFWK